VSVTTYADRPMKSTDVGRSRGPAILSTPPRGLTRISAPVFGDAGWPSLSGFVGSRVQMPCERAYSPWGPSSTSVTSGAPRATSVAAAPGVKVSTRPASGECGTGPA